MCTLRHPRELSLVCTCRHVLCHFRFAVSVNLPARLATQGPTAASVAISVCVKWFTAVPVPSIEVTCVGTMVPVGWFKSGCVAALVQIVSEYFPIFPNQSKIGNSEYFQRATGGFPRFGSVCALVNHCLWRVENALPLFILQPSAYSHGSNLSNLSGGIQR
mmetsp:Transcript_8766/g.14432  ORF Transcript_8766/g.14432 Transcript_8766/m.14432 type:complete len:161 (+) Transcript_8766:135-617(+)